MFSLCVSEAATGVHGAVVPYKKIQNGLSCITLHGIGDTSMKLRKPGTMGVSLLRDIIANDENIFLEIEGWSNIAEHL